LTILGWHAHVWQLAAEWRLIVARRGVSASPKKSSKIGAKYYVSNINKDNTL
jgi:hypothetical protein